MGFLGIKDQTFLVVGFANKKSVAWAVAKTLESEGAKVIYSVRTEKRKEELSKLIDEQKILVCDFEYPEQIKKFSSELTHYLDGKTLGGVLHSIAFANYSEGLKPFYQTRRKDFLQAMLVSSFSLVELSNICKPLIAHAGSVVSIGISSTDVTAENYGYMAPIKASLDTNVRYLAKSFSKDTEIRFNSVNAGPLKTSASAGIPGYLVNYMYAEKLTFRKKALATNEVANLAVFLLSPCSSGINGQNIIIDAGMGLNYFDQDIVNSSMKIND